MYLRWVSAVSSVAYSRDRSLNKLAANVVWWCHYPKHISLGSKQQRRQLKFLCDSNCMSIILSCKLCLVRDTLMHVNQKMNFTWVYKLFSLNERVLSGRCRTNRISDNEQLHIPSASTSLIISWSSASVGFCPRDLITVPSSFVVIVPSPSLSNSENASLNSASQMIGKCNYCQPLWLQYLLQQVQGQPLKISRQAFVYQ